MRPAPFAWPWLSGLLVAAAGLGAMAGSTAGCGSAVTAGPTTPLPEAIHFAFPDLEGKVHKPEDYLGKVLFVDVWATWCEPCKESLPYYDALQKRLGPKGLVIVGVNIDEEAEVVTTFLEKQPISFTVLLDPEQTLPEQLGASAMPAAYLLDRQGKVVWAHTTFREGHKKEIEAAIERALAE